MIYNPVLSANPGADQWHCDCWAEGACNRVTSGPVPCSCARRALGQGAGRSQRRDSARRSRAERCGHQRREVRLRAYFLKTYLWQNIQLLNRDKPSGALAWL